MRSPVILWAVAGMSCIRPAAPALNLHQDFEGRITNPQYPFPSAHGSLSRQNKPGMAPTKSDGPADALLLTGAQASAGQQSLLFRDVPGLPAAHYPMLVFAPNHRAGMSTVAFDLYLEPKAYFIHEWRTAGNPYATGPVVTIKDGRLTGTISAMVGTMKFNLTRAGEAADGMLSALPPGSPTPIEMPLHLERTIEARSSKEARAWTGQLEAGAQSVTLEDPDAGTLDEHKICAAGHYAPTKALQPTGLQGPALLLGGNVGRDGRVKCDRVYLHVIQRFAHPLQQQQGILVAPCSIATGGHRLYRGGAQSRRAGGGQKGATHRGLAHPGIGTGHKPGPGHIVSTTPKITS